MSHAAEHPIEQAESAADPSAGSHLLAVIDRITDGFFAMDREGRFTVVNPRAEELIGRERSRLVGRSLRELLPEAVETRFHRKFQEAMTQQRPVHFEQVIPGRAETFMVRMYPSESGVTVFFRAAGEPAPPDLDTRPRTALPPAQESFLAADGLLGIVAHELRDPLHAIGTYVALVGDAGLSEAVRADAVHGVNRVIQRMDRLIGDLLDITRLQARQGIPIDPREIDSAALVAESVALFSREIRAKRFSLTVSCEETARVHADPERVLQVLSNLLGNAVKFTPAGGDISIRSYAVGGLVWFEVADSGPGIEPENREHLFDPFWQAPGTASLGSGLGLAIARALIEAQGGTLGVQSEPGSGSTFRFSLPSAPR
jgi:PAS domain S-box-containing protein